MREVFRVGLLYRQSVEHYKQVSVPDWTCGSAPNGALKRGCIPDWTCGLSPRGALKTKRCSRLDSWIVPAYRLNNGEVFQIGPK